MILNTLQERREVQPEVRKLRNHFMYTCKVRYSSNYVYKYPIDIVGLLYLDSSLHDLHNPLLANFLLSHPYIYT